MQSRLYDTMWWHGIIMQSHLSNSTPSEPAFLFDLSKAAVRLKRSWSLINRLLPTNCLGAYYKRKYALLSESNLFQIKFDGLQILRAIEVRII